MKFHDFLIYYKQTPRTKLLRRHLPDMEAVVEESSQYEQSAVSRKDLEKHNISINSEDEDVFQFNEYDEEYGTN